MLGIAIRAHSGLRWMARRAKVAVSGFCGDSAGGYSIAFAVALIPILGGMAIAVDFAEMSRQRQATLNALDAAGIATARHVVSGATDDQLKAYAKDFFEANLGPVDPADTTLHVQLPNNEAGGGTLKLTADLRFQPAFFPVFTKALKGVADTSATNFSAGTEIRLKNTLEVALVLDNSGSMAYFGSGSGEKRIDLLKTAAKQLVDTLAAQANLIRQVEMPVQFSLVPFAASVNVGPGHAGAAWMDSRGLSPVHHENFNWSAVNATSKRAEKIAGVWRKKGVDWGVEENEILSRFSLYKDMKKVESREWVVTSREYVCTEYRDNGTCRKGKWVETGYYEETIGTYASWQGCVEARPYPYNVNDATPGTFDDFDLFTGDPATLFVPMFAPDEPGDRWATPTDDSPDGFSATNNWWNDGTEDSSGQTRLRNMTKYLDVRPYGAGSSQGTGPNYGCTTNPITSLTDVGTEEGLATIKTAIDAMAPNGGTNVPEGMAWGWRTISSGAPFSEGRPDTERGNDKVVIVLTDGENTYYTPSSLGYSDPAGSKSIYSSYGYLAPGYNGTGTGRLFMGTSSAIGQLDYSNTNYTAALNEQMGKLCDNAKDGRILVMTVSLDLSTTNTAENKAIEALKRCASDSRFRKNADGSAAKLFWNATGSNLSEKFKEIADELSNLRIVG
jgi:Flp pilus assembly protein TadG